VSLTQSVHQGLCLRLILIVAAIVGVDALSPAIGAGSAPIISTSKGAVAGIQSASMNEYLGIPYATPPVGPLRWTPPQAHSSWKGVLEATQFGNECPQFDFTGKVIGNEDCLYLNVYTPRKQRQNEGENLPVMVWIHGGAYTSGSGDPYDPTRLVAKEMIVVTINYRIGLLGFFAHPAIDAEGHLNGNYGLMDQRLALKWAKRNIGAFGGDPTRVTIFGQSAGGHSVYAHLASPLSKGLFQRAIAESGAYVQFQDYFGFVMPLAAAETTGLLPSLPSGILEASLVNCGGDSSAATAACLRAVPAASFVNIAPSTLYAIIDGTLLPQSPTAAISSGRFNRVPVMTGSNHDEYRVFIAEDYDFQGNPLTNSGYQAALENFFGTKLGDSLLNVYPLPSSPPANAASLALSTALTDGLFACPERNSVKLLSQFVKTYAYEFNDEDAPPTQAFFDGVLTFPLGAYHTAELQFLFIGDFFGFPVLPLSADERALSDAMVSYWTRFGKTGNPNSTNTPLWAPYSSSTDQFQSFIPPMPSVESTFDAEHLCSAFWNTF